MSRLTFQDLVVAAQSSEQTVRKSALEAYQAWVRAAPKLPVDSRLTQVERVVLDRIFAANGLLGGSKR